MVSSAQQQHAVVKNPQITHPPFIFNSEIYSLFSLYTLCSPSYSCLRGEVNKLISIQVLPTGRSPSSVKQLSISNIKTLQLVI